MSEQTENTFTAYLGPEFQQKLMWQLLVEPEYAEKTLPILAVEYFDDPNFKRLFLIILEYYKAYLKVPNLQNQSINQAINEFKTPNNVIEEESLFAVIEKIKLWNERVLNKTLMHDGEAVQSSTDFFIKQQEYRKFAEGVLIKVKSGEIKNKQSIAEIEEKLHKISLIGNKEDDGIDVTEGLEKALRKEFRKTIPTGVETIDGLTGGGLGKGEVGLILTPSGVGKAQPLSSQILTPDGWIKMGDIKMDDLVIGSDGKPTKVLGVYPQGKRPIYKVEFNDQTMTFCDEEHLWAVNSRNNRSANTTIQVNGKSKHIKIPNFKYTPKITKEIINSLHFRDGELNYRIPIIKAVQFNKKELPINPYLLGVLIGDGGLTQSSIKFTSVDIDIINKVRNIINNDYVRLSLKQISNTISYSITGKSGKTNELYKVIKDFGLNVTSNFKFIPNNYKYSSISDRILLLQGLLDTDGYASKSGRVQYSTTSKKLAFDIKEIILSLGGFCNMREKLPKYKYNNEIKFGKKSYILTISFSNTEIKLFSLERKQKRVIYRNKYKNNKYISSITYSHEEEAQCIYVENNDHLYVTDDYILTHNTTLLTKIANTAREQNLNVLQIIFEDTIEQIQRKHVTIWTGIPLSELDERNAEALQKSNEHIEKKLGAGKLTIKKFSQEDITMRDVKDFVIREQKKWGFKYDIVILDYLDCLESHKRTADRNEAELVIVKSFIAMASDLDIPCWSAIQSNRSGFDAELVEAYQTGGSIKRLQKAHFFMSVAKTPDQKEASLASIRIIKARFAKDGQTFKDCIFNNDTMHIDIKDERYVGGIYVHKKKVTDEVIEENNKKIEEQAKKIEEHGMGSGFIHVVASNAISDTPEDPLLGDMREKFMEQKKTETDIVNIHIETTRTDLSQDEINQITEITKDAIKENDILELEDKPIEKFDGVNDGVNEGISEGVNEGIKEPILDWSGETFTTATNEIEVKHEDIKAGDVIKTGNGPVYLPPGIFTRDESNNIVVLGVSTESKIIPEVKKIVPTREKIDISEIENKLNFDPEEASPARKHLAEMLWNKAKNPFIGN